MKVTRENAGGRETGRMVTFEITTTTPLPVGQQVFISGNIDMLGAWRPDGFPLTRLDDNVWAGYAMITAGLPLEFKITRGTWSSEEADEQGVAISGNKKIPPAGAASFKHTVLRWIDRA